MQEKKARLIPEGNAGVPEQDAGIPCSPASLSPDGAEK